MDQGIFEIKWKTCNKSTYYNQKESKMQNDLVSTHLYPIDPLWSQPTFFHQITLDDMLAMCAIDNNVVISFDYFGDEPRKDMMHNATLCTTWDPCRLSYLYRLEVRYQSDQRLLVTPQTAVLYKKKQPNTREKCRLQCIFDSSKSLPFCLTPNIEHAK